ncbi:MAG: 3'-5' exonuclease [Planctomycetota bacterium]|nr:3'-5' exonuclease [Planctomycetota bacterium]
MPVGGDRIQSSQGWYIIYDTESVVDGSLLSRTEFAGQDLSPEEALSKEQENRLEASGGRSDFISVGYHVPVSICLAAADKDFRLRKLKALGAPDHDPIQMVREFWEVVETTRTITLVDYNGRSWDLPLLTLSAFRFGVPCPVYMGGSGPRSFRYRFGERHLDLHDWLSGYGAARWRGGLDLLAKMIGRPGKLDVHGDQVGTLYLEGKLQAISDYCLGDVLNTYFVFLRTRVLTGELTIEREQEIVADARSWLNEQSARDPILANGIRTFLDSFGTWNPTPFV